MGRQREGFLSPFAPTSDDIAPAVILTERWLPDDQREAIRLRYLSGRSLEETAAAMQRSPGAVRGLVQRAKQALRGAMVRSTLWLSKK